MSLDKFVQLDGQLKETQRELADAKAQIAQVIHSRAG
jgi:phage shock protein A